MVSAVLIKGLPKLAKKGWKKLTADKDAIRKKDSGKSSYPWLYGKSKCETRCS